MEILKAIKTVYAGTGDKVMFYSPAFTRVWTNDRTLPEIEFSELEFDQGAHLHLPLEKEVLCRTKSSNIAVRVRPISDEGKLAGYILVLYRLQDAQKIFAHSMKEKEQEVLIGNVRLGLNDLNVTAERLKRNPLYFSRDAVHDMHNAVLHTLAPITNQELVGKLHSGKCKMTSVYLSGPLTRACDEVRRYLESPICSLTYFISEGIGLKGSWEMIEASVLNLIINAYMYCNAPVKRITVTLDEKPGKIRKKAVLTVSDNGTYVDLDRIERLSHYCNREIEFQTRECLGLTLARDTAALHGGTISFGNSPSGGLEVTMTLPSGDDNGFIIHNDNRFVHYTPYDHQLCILAKGGDIKL